jgi:hypothetical protein
VSNSFIEAVESRVFLSAAPIVISTAVKADQLTVRGQLLKFESDALLSEVKLINDTTAIKKSLTKGDTSLVTPFKNLRADSKSLGMALRADRLAQAANALADESTIKLDLLQILKDKNSGASLTADKAKLLSDRVKLQNDLVAGLDSRIATRQADEMTITNDTQAIVTAEEADPLATAALNTAVTTFQTDRNGRLATLTSDLQTVEAARTQLSNDLAAQESP